ncbi:unnamed protein product [Darwinula stevensoni]|uniref:G-patch domain-containing protein n=1 Tax=Darwinula stevensoni TaxID=69355 RepID=A0A7R9AFL1_9CRUS|nr:unnamed protein product [Darwinula stevensoni]CAG0903416.1 unnamed protein product [Darwinula stevensoni]
MEETQESCRYVLIRNIPKEFHSKDLRNYFFEAVEDGKFLCFHFRHRPEVLPGGKGSETVCCVVKVLERDHGAVLAMYDRRHWMDGEGKPLPQKCVLIALKVSESETVEDHSVPLKDLMQLSELRPPVGMPRGNVGTPTKVFRELIRRCQLPARMIRSLALQFPKRKPRKYGKVPFDYGRQVVTPSPEEMTVLTGTGHEIPRRIVPGGEKSEPSKEKYHGETSDREESDPESEGEEEWDRQEALHPGSHLSKYERDHERLFEEGMEIVWEKGGSGLVFYTDAYYWDDQEGDFDERTADDLDVDMGVYETPLGGDKDARDLAQIHWEWDRESASMVGRIGAFERHTRGIGRRLMEAQGWRDGQGLGPGGEGMSDALGSDGKHPKDKTGFGYHGEKISRTRRRQPKRRTDVYIGTVFDAPAPDDTVKRRRKD